MKQLFPISAIQPPSVSHLIHPGDSVSGFITAPAREVMKSLFHVLENNSAAVIISDGKFSAHQLIEILLKLSGKGSDVFVTSWGMTEDPCRSLIRLKASGEINNLYGIFDFRVQQKMPAIWAMAKKNFTEIKAMSIHAKMILIQGPQESFAVHTSANLSNNTRIESSMISAGKRASLELYGWFSQFFDYDCYRTDEDHRAPSGVNDEGGRYRSGERNTA